MRGVFISQLYPSKDLPQYCIFLEQQAKALIESGVDIDVIRLSKGIKEKEEIFNDINIYNISIKNNIRDKFFLLEDKELQEKLKKIVVEKKYDFISAHFLTDKMLKNVLSVCRSLDIKLFAHYHGLNIWEDYYCKHKIYAKYLAFLRKRLFKKVIKNGGIIGVSDKVKNVIAEKKIIDNVFTVYNGVDIELFDKKYKKEDEYISLICVANLIPIKGQRELIEAFNILVKKYPFLKLKLIGRGSDEEYLKRKVKEYKLEEQISFIGYVGYQEVSRYIAESDIFVMPSYYEALGCVYLEAMASGVPIIGCENMGIAEIVEHKKTGILVEEKNIEDLKEGIEILIRDSDLREKIAANAYKLVKEKYTWKHSAEQLIKIYLGEVKNN